MEIISVGKRLKNIRKQLNIRQDEITGNEITRNLISIIENDKTSMTPKVAEILSREINAICKERELDFSITVEALIESEESYCERLALGLMEELEGVTHEYFTVENLNRVMSMDIHLRFYKLFHLAFNLLTICEAIVGNKDIELGYIFSKRVVELSDYVNNEQANIKNAINLSYYSINLSKYDEARLVCRAAIRKYTQMNSTDLFRLLMNLNIAAIKLNDNLTSEEAINAMLRIKDLSTLERNKALISQANRKYLLGMYEEAKFIYRDLLSNTAIDESYLVYSNLLDIYRVTQAEDLNKIISDAKQFNEDDLTRNSVYLCKFFWKLSMAFRSIDDYDNYKIYLERAFKLKSDVRLSGELKLIIEDTLVFLDKSNDSEIADFLYQQMYELVKNKQLKANDEVIWHFLKYWSSNYKDERLVHFSEIMLEEIIAASPKCK